MCVRESEGAREHTGEIGWERERGNERERKRERERERDREKVSKKVSERDCRENERDR